MMMPPFTHVTRSCPEDSGTRQGTVHRGHLLVGGRLSIEQLSEEAAVFSQDGTEEEVLMVEEVRE